jgi:general secretion pathway protein I
MRQRGFTLIEIVVAFVMLCLVLATSYQIFTAGLQRAGDLEDSSHALLIAQSQIAQASLGDTFEPGTTAGESEDRRFRYATQVSAFDDGTDLSNNKLLATYQAVRIGVRVTWTTAAAQERQLDLATLVVGKVGP